MTTNANTAFYGDKSPYNLRYKIILIIEYRIAVATAEADEAIASFDFLKIIGISTRLSTPPPHPPKKGANRGDSAQF